MSCYIHRDGTFDLKIHADVVLGGGNLYNLDEMEREMIFYKTIKKIGNETREHGNKQATRRQIQTYGNIPTYLYKWMSPCAQVDMSGATWKFGTWKQTCLLPPCFLHLHLLSFVVFFWMLHTIYQINSSLFFLYL